MIRTLQLLLALAWVALLGSRLQAAHAVDPADERARGAAHYQELERAARSSLSDKVAVGRERYESQQTYRRALVANLSEQAEAARARAQQEFGPGGAEDQGAPTGLGGQPIAFAIWSVFALGSIFFLWRRRRRLKAALAMLPIFG